MKAPVPQTLRIILGAQQFDVIDARLEYIQRALERIGPALELLAAAVAEPRVKPLPGLASISPPRAKLDLTPSRERRGERRKKT